MKLLTGMLLIALMLWGLPVAAQESGNVGRLLETPNLPQSLYRYRVTLPDHLERLLTPVARGSAEAITDAGATLGRVMFYDLKLSKNELVSCASCHAQALGFDDPTRFSIGFAGKITRRHAMGLANGLFNQTGRFFWDERAENLEAQVMAPFFDPVEMGLEEGELTAKVRQNNYYGCLFEDAFGDKEVTKPRIANALSQFVRSMVSDASLYDVERGKVESVGQIFLGYTSLQNRGKFLYLNPASAGGAGCGNCHKSDAFVMEGPKNNGLDAVSSGDKGWGAVSAKQEDDGKFRAASLKNISIRGPYMHDGRFDTLSEVIEHYNSGIQPHINLDRALKNTDGSPLKLNLSDKDKRALLAFLATLSDQKFLEDRRFSNPFRH